MNQWMKECKQRRGHVLILQNRPRHLIPSSLWFTRRAHTRLELSHLKKQQSWAWACTQHIVIKLPVIKACGTSPLILTQCVFTYQAVSSRWKEENGWMGVFEHIYQLFSQVLLYVICLNCLTCIETALSVLGFWQYFSWSLQSSFLSDAIVKLQLLLYF